MPKAPITDSSRARIGTLAGLGCYIFWGLCPLYWKLLTQVNSFEVIANRMIWCLVFVLILCKVMRLEVLPLFRDPRARKYLVTSGLFITFNWSLYIWAVNSGHVVETAIGYYINPLISILLGMVIFKERLTKLQWVAVALCAAGVIFFTVNYGQFPWIAILLAVTFGIYGAVKKKAGYPATQALAVESALMAPIALCMGVAAALLTGSYSFLADVSTLGGWQVTLLLIGGGIVTGVPLVLFAKAANEIPLSILGFLQYFSPSIALLLGVFVFGEAFTLAHAVCLGCIWAGLVLVAIDRVIASKAQTPSMND